MDLDKLKTFHQVATLGSISKATAALGMDKSSISRQLSLLEDQIQKKLFDRKDKKLILTPTGIFLLKKATSILMEVEATKSALLSDAENIQGSLTISTTYSLASTWLSKIIHEFIEKNPYIHLNIQATNQPVNLLLREADVAIRPYIHDKEGLCQKHLKTVYLRMYASKKYLDKFGIPQNASELIHHRLIILGDGPNVPISSQSTWPLIIKAENGKFCQSFLTINSPEGLFNLVSNGIGIGHFIDNSPLIKDSGLIPLLHEAIYHPVDIYYTYPKQLENLESIKSFEKFIFEHARKSL